MASVSAKVVGGSLQLKDAETISALAALLGVPNHQATVNGEAQDAGFSLTEGDFVTFAEKVKGA